MRERWRHGVLRVMLLGVGQVSLEEEKESAGYVMVMALYLGLATGASLALALQPAVS
jgi:hypothetical protein